MARLTRLFVLSKNYVPGFDVVNRTLVVSFTYPNCATLNVQNNNKHKMNRSILDQLLKTTSSVNSAIILLYNIKTVNIII